VAEVPRAPFAVCRSVASAHFSAEADPSLAQSTASYRYLAEPKDVLLSQPELSCRFEPGCLVLASKTPVFDAYIEGCDEDLVLGHNFVTLLRAGQRRIPARGRCTTISVRTLHGVQRVPVSPTG
jgi:hypothetical protein